MANIKFKHAEHLINFADCPSAQCAETEREVFRWVHSPTSDADFIPLPLMKNRTPRLLDESDRQLSCADFSLSVWESLEKAKSKYLGRYSRMRTDEDKQKYIEEKGNMVALIKLKPEYGVLSENKGGHFSLYEYEGVGLHNEIQQKFSIFDI